MSSSAEAIPDIPQVPVANNVDSKLDQETIPDEKKAKHNDTWSVNAPCVITAVLFKEAALDSPTFRASMNHLDNQMNDVDRWLESFTRGLSKQSLEMDCKFFHNTVLLSLLTIF